MVWFALAWDDPAPPPPQPGLCADYADTPLEKPLKLVLKVGGSEVTELSGSGHDSSYYDDRSDHERERHREKKKKKKKKSEKEKHLDDEERRKRKVRGAGPQSTRVSLQLQESSGQLCSFGLLRHHSLADPCSGS